MEHVSAGAEALVLIKWITGMSLAFDRLPSSTTAGLHSRRALRVEPPSPAPWLSVVCESVLTASYEDKVHTHGSLGARAGVESPGQVAWDAVSAEMSTM